MQSNMIFPDKLCKEIATCSLMLGLLQKCKAANMTDEETDLSRQSSSSAP